ncbi:cytidine deaminase-like protein [Paraphoma chrysanthemicola]|nr:cytidine deaminase-like protein [Paraphoma chrysanthemicola]
MRSLRARTARRAYASFTAEQSPQAFRRRPTAAPCIFCEQRTPGRMSAPRFQSTAAASNSREEPFGAQSTAPSQPQTHYDFFPKALPSGAPPNAPFTIDLQALKREFLQLQARAHPDMHPQVDKKRAEATSARINEAYKTLQNPLHRAQYLLSLKGIEVAEDETAKVEDPELLMEVLEAREQIEEAEREMDLVEMKHENDQRIRDSEATLEKAFQDEDIDLAKSETVRLRYSSVPHGKPRLSQAHHQVSPRCVASSLLPSTMTATSFQSAEATADKDGLIHGVSAQELQILGEQCIEAKGKAYCPYSLFRVGASLLLNSTITPAPNNCSDTYPLSHVLTGANIENAAYPVGTCAERVAMGTAVHLGHRIGSFKAVGVSTDIEEFCSPCGMCRQYLREFLSLETPIFMFNREGKFIVRTMGELLPLSFGPDVLPPREQLRKAQEEDKAKTA